MSEIRNIIVALVGCCLVASCSTDETPADRLPDGKYPLTFTTAVDETADTRTMTATRTVTSTRATTDGTWRGDGSEKIAVQIADEVREYAAHGSGNSAQLTSDTPFYWQTSGETKDVRGWYYGTGYSGVLKSAWAVQSDQSRAGGLVESEGYWQSDFLYAPVQPVSFRDESKELVFYHQTARVVIHIVKAEAANTATISEIKIGDQDNLALSGAYTAPTVPNVHTGTWDVSGSSVTMGTILPNTLPVSDADKYLASYTALVIPQKMSEKVNRKFIAVTLSDGNTYYYTPKSTDADLESGKEYTYNITVKYGYLEVEAVTGSVWGGDGSSIAVGSKVLAAGFSSSDLKIGDYYYSDGSTSDGGYRKYKDGSTALLKILPVLVNPKTGWGRTVVGIVFNTDVSRVGEAAKKALAEKGVSTPHGLVMALTNASEGCRWGDENMDENSGGAAGEPFTDNVDILKKMYADVNGYAETHWIIETYGKNGSTALQDTYQAFYHASRYGTEDGGTSQYAAPPATTGWFIPSMGQWWNILSNLGGIDLRSYQDKEGWSDLVLASTAVDNINKNLEKISGATKFNAYPCFWSSSEYNSYGACDMRFDTSTKPPMLLLGSSLKYISYGVRCSLAF